MRAKRSRRRRARRRAWWVLGGVAAVLLVGVLTAWHNRGALAGALAGTLQPHNVQTVQVQHQRPFSILVISNENQPNYAAPQLTDTIMVLVYDPRHKSVSLISVPRDLWVTLPTYGGNRINAAYEDGGVSSAALMVEKYVGVPVEYYAIVNYHALVDLVNAVGGVNVVVPPGVTGKGIYDTCYPNAAENACTTFILPVGPAHLNGTEALQFSRERHSFADGDIQRERDQQQVLLSLRHQLLQPSNLLRVPQIVNDLLSLVQTNVPYADIPALAQAVLHVPKTSIHQAVLGFSSGAVSTWVTPGGADVLLGNQPVIHQIVGQTFAPILQHMGSYTVQVENGSTTTVPVAGDFTSVLDTMGVPTMPPAQARSNNHQQNAVYVNTAVLKVAGAQDAPTEAYILARMLGTSVQLRSMPGSAAQIVAILGSTFPPL